MSRREVVFLQSLTSPSNTRSGSSSGSNSFSSSSPNNGRKTGGSTVTLDMLPPIQNLDPVELKNFSRDELACYIESQGVVPEHSKPGMKRQMRELLRVINPQVMEAYERNRQASRRTKKTPSLRRRDVRAIAGRSASRRRQAAAASQQQAQPTAAMLSPGIQVSTVDKLDSPSLKGKASALKAQLTRQTTTDLDVMVTPQFHSPAPVKPQQTPTISTTALTIALTGSTVPSEPPRREVCVEPYCSKKANRDCSYQRCRSCCLRANVPCAVHQAARTIRGGGGGRLADMKDASPTSTSLEARNAAIAAAASLAEAQQQQQQQQQLEMQRKLQAQQQKALLEAAAAASAAQRRKRTLESIQIHPDTPQGIPRARKLLFTPHHLHYRRSAHNIFPQPHLPLASQVLTGKHNQQDLVNQYYTKQCSNCQQTVSCVGSDFYQHISKCDPETFEAIMKGAKIDTNEQKNETPLQKATIQAKQRYALNTQVLNTLFAPTVDQAVFSTRRPTAQQFQERVVDPLTKMVEYVDNIGQKWEKEGIKEHHVEVKQLNVEQQDQVFEILEGLNQLKQI